MQRGAALDAILRSEAIAAAPVGEAVSNAILGMAKAATVLSEMIARPPLDCRLGAGAGTSNADGDGQRRLDLVAEEMFSTALRALGSAAICRKKPRAPASSIREVRSRWPSILWTARPTST